MATATLSYSAPPIDVPAPQESNEAPAGGELQLEYPYNVAHAYLPVPASRVPAQMEALGVKAPLYEDTDVKTDLPQVQVDYLSPNEWKDESDVWASWKEMTKRKQSVEDGIRLENASWRTWAQQRHKLKTISPETLNWLKDSDVTWLYGPLHEAGKQPSMPLRESESSQASAAGELETSGKKRKGSLMRRKSSSSKTGAEVPRQGILKHRTLTDMLTSRAESPATNGSGSNSVPYESDADDGPAPPQQTRRIAFALPEA